MRLLAALIILAAPATAQSVTDRPSGTTALLQAVSVVDSTVAWVTGHRGTVLRTRDGGASWLQRPVPGADSLEFRDVHALSAEVAWVLSAGPGERSRIYHTRDGGTTWSEQFHNRDPQAFYDCFAFLDARRAIAFSDASAGRTNLLVTRDGGTTWQRRDSATVPTPLDGEGAFAASGGCVATFGDRDVWVALGGPGARLFRSRDGGDTWQVHQTPIVRGASAGNTAASFLTGTRGIVVGGRIDAYGSDTSSAAVALTSDGGATWVLGQRPPRPGALFGVTWLPALGPDAVLAAGPGGLFLSRDAGTRWETLDTRAFWSIGAHGRRGYAVGPRGTIATITW